MAIDYRGLGSLTARELIAALSRDGFYFVRQRGSHQRYAHADGRRVTVAPHGGGDTFTIKTLKSMIETWGKGTAIDVVRIGLVRGAAADRSFRGLGAAPCATLDITPPMAESPITARA